MFNTLTGIFLLRIFIGARLIYGVWDNIISWDHMLRFKEFLATNNFPMPLVCAVTSVYAQFICGILLIIGWKTRWAAVAMMINFLIAAFIEMPGGIEAMTPALAIFFSCLLFFLDGAGNFSIDRRRKV